MGIQLPQCGGGAKINNWDYIKLKNIPAQQKKLLVYLYTIYIKQGVDILVYTHKKKLLRVKQNKNNPIKSEQDMNRHVSKDIQMVKRHIKILLIFSFYQENGDQKHKEQQKSSWDGNVQAFKVSETTVTL